MTNSYLIVSQYLTEERIDNYFKDKDWKKLNKNKKNPTLFYLDYLNIYNKKYYNYQPFIKNLIGNDKHLLTDKTNLHLMLPSKYLMKTYNFNLKDDIEKYKNIFKNNKKFILKPAKGREGIAIRIVENYEEMKEYLYETIKKIDFRKIKETDKWVIQEYIQNPYLYEKRKFHFRVYFLIINKDIYYFSKYLIATAEWEYKNENYLNTKIHDSHYNEKSIRNKLFPEDFQINNEEEINNQVNNIFKNVKKNINLPMKCYPEDKHCYELFAADIMMTKEKNLKVLEFNHSVGYPETMDKKYPMFENQLDIVLKTYNLIDKINMENNYFIKV